MTCLPAGRLLTATCRFILRSLGEGGLILRSLGEGGLILRSLGKGGLILRSLGGGGLILRSLGGGGLTFCQSPLLWLNLGTFASTNKNQQNLN